MVFIRSAQLKPSDHTRYVRFVCILLDTKGISHGATDIHCGHALEIVFSDDGFISFV